MQRLNNLPVWGDPDAETILQMQEALKHEAYCGALMADHHIGYSVPIGGVIAYEGNWLGAEVFVSFDKKAVKLLAAQGELVRLLT